MGRLGAILGVLGLSWGLLGHSWEPLGPSWRPLASSWGPLGPPWGPTWPPRKPPKKVVSTPFSTLVYLPRSTVPSGDAQHTSQRPSRRRKRLPGGPKEAPRGPQKAPKTPQEAYKRLQEAPKRLTRSHGEPSEPHTPRKLQRPPNPRRTTQGNSITYTQTRQTHAKPFRRHIPLLS